jgi:hypothetical protein
VPDPVGIGGVSTRAGLAIFAMQHGLAAPGARID